MCLTFERVSTIVQKSRVNNCMYCIDTMKNDVLFSEQKLYYNAITSLVMCYSGIQSFNNAI